MCVNIKYILEERCCFGLNILKILQINIILFLYNVTLFLKLIQFQHPKHPYILQ